MKLQIDRKKCSECGLCKRVCILTTFCGFEDLQQAAQEHCINCGHCVAICPKNAIHHPKIKEVLSIGPLPKSDEVQNLLMKTRSVRDFKKEGVPPAKWEELRRVMGFSQSGLNAQDVEVIVTENRPQLNKIQQETMKMYDLLKRLYDFPPTRLWLKWTLGKQDFASVKLETQSHAQRKIYMKNGNDPILYGAPALVQLIAPDKSIAAPDNATVIAQNIMLTATALGLGCCYMGGLTVGYNTLKYKPLIKALGIPAGFKLYQAFVVGSPTVQLSRMPERKPRQIHFR